MLKYARIPTFTEQYVQIRTYMQHLNKYVLKRHMYDYGQHMYQIRTKIRTICTGRGVNPLHGVSIWSVFVRTQACTFIRTVRTNTDQILQYINDSRRRSSALE